LSYLLLKYIHVLGRVVILGTGTGIAFFMLMAHRSGDIAFIARTAGVVVLAEFVFTATAVIAQPITGFLLLSHAGHGLADFLVMLSIGLYILTGFFMAAGGLDAEMHARSRGAGGRDGHALAGPLLPTV